MSETLSREEIFTMNVEEEASVLEIYRALKAQFPQEQAVQLEAWLRSHIEAEAGAERLGFYVDEFGARDVVELDVDEALALLQQEQVWSEHSDTMLHLYSSE